MNIRLCCCCSVTKSCPTLWPHGLQHARLACPPLSPRICSSSCPLSQWCYLTISSSATPSSFYLQSSPASVFSNESNESALHIRLPKYWSFSFSISPFNEYSGLISFGMDWFGLLAVQGTLQSLLQRHLIKNVHLLGGCAVLGHISHVQLFATPWTVACQSPLSMNSPGKKTGVDWHALLHSCGMLFSCSVVFDTVWPYRRKPDFPVLRYLLELAQSDVRPLSRWCYLTTSSSVTPFSSCPQSFPASRSFSNKSALLTRWPQYLSFSFSINPSNEYLGLISFGIDSFDLLAVQGTLKSLLQHSLQTSILWHSDFFMVQLSQPYMTTGKKHSFEYMDLYQQSDVFAF